MPSFCERLSNDRPAYLRNIVSHLAVITTQKTRDLLD